MRRPSLGYVASRRAVALFEDFQRKAEAYWCATIGPREVEQMVPKVQAQARQLGESTWVTNQTMRSGVVLPTVEVDLLTAVTLENQAHGNVGRDLVREAINRCIGRAELARDEAWHRRVRPWYWVVDVPAFVATIPFQVLEQMGLPREVEEHAISQVIRIVIAMAALAAISYFGLEAAIPFVGKLLGG